MTEVTFTEAVSGLITSEMWPSFYGESPLTLTFRLWIVVWDLFGTCSDRLLWITMVQASREVRPSLVMFVGLKYLFEHSLTLTFDLDPKNSVLYPIDEHPVEMP